MLAAAEKQRKIREVSCRASQASFLRVRPLYERMGRN